MGEIIIGECWRHIYVKLKGRHCHSNVFIHTYTRCVMLTVDGTYLCGLFHFHWRYERSWDSWWCCDMERNLCPTHFSMVRAIEPKTNEKELKSETYTEYFVSSVFCIIFNTEFCFMQRVFFCCCCAFTPFIFVACCEQKFICFLFKTTLHIYNDTAWLVLNSKCKMTWARFGIQLKFVSMCLCIYVPHCSLHKSRVLLISKHSVGLCAHKLLSHQATYCGRFEFRYDQSVFYFILVCEYIFNIYSGNQQSILFFRLLSTGVCQPQFYLPKIYICWNWTIFFSPMCKWIMQWSIV